jgi:hypothetical protein
VSSSDLEKRLGTFPDTLLDEFFLIQVGLRLDARGESTLRRTDVGGTTAMHELDMREASGPVDPAEIRPVESVTS